MSEKPAVTVGVQSHGLKDSLNLYYEREFLVGKLSCQDIPLTCVKEVAYVSTFPPRKCGIATFTADLVNSIGRLNILRIKESSLLTGDGCLSQSPAGLTLNWPRLRR